MGKDRKPMGARLLGCSFGPLGARLFGHCSVGGHCSVIWGGCTPSMHMPVGLAYVCLVHLDPPKYIPPLNLYLWACEGARGGRF